ncbi:MAG: GyrI-like domain-containing protein [Caldilineaceae bacterium]
MNAHSDKSSNTTSTEPWVDYRAAIDRVTAYIHSHNDDPLQLDQLAEVAGFSPFHFHRIFTAMMGESVAEYIRRLRLGSAVQQLLQSDATVTEIALAAGYETHAAFSKAFRKRFGIAPTTLRTMDRVAAYALLLEQPALRQPKGRKVTPEIRTLPDLCVLYARGWGIIDFQYFVASNAAFAALFRFLRSHNLMGKYGARLGITPDNYSVVPHDQCRFDAGVVLNPGVEVELDETVAIQVIPGGRWAVFPHRGAYDTLWQSWNSAYRDWLPRSGEMPRDIPPIEIYINNIRETPVEELMTEILIPIV